MNPLIRIIPPFLVRFFARPYVAGDSLRKALDVVEALWRERGLLSTLDLLAEDIETREQAERNLATYLQMVDGVAALGGGAGGGIVGQGGAPTLSLKPSSYTTSPLQAGGDASGSLAAIERIAAHAAGKGVGLTIDMESRHWTDFTLDALQRVHAAGHRDVGIVLQTRLHRTEADLARLPKGVRVRLVIGIYREPAEVALTAKPAMKERMLEYAARLLRQGHYVEFATHDELCVRRFVEDIVPACGTGPDGYEVQMLYGVPRERLQTELRARGVKVRLYVPFALSWDMAIQYLRRRLDEYPAMALLVARNYIFRK